MTPDEREYSRQAILQMADERLMQRMLLCGVPLAELEADELRAALAALLNSFPMGPPIPPGTRWKGKPPTPAKPAGDFIDWKPGNGTDGQR